MSRSPWTKTWGQPVRVKLETAGTCPGQVGQREDMYIGILVTGELTLGLPQEGGKPYVLELNGLRQGQDLFPFTKNGAEESDVDAGTVILFKVLRLRHENISIQSKLMR